MGSFDKYAESHKKKRGAASVDAAFLSEIEQWREQLAGNIALRNPRKSGDSLLSSRRSPNGKSETVPVFSGFPDELSPTLIIDDKTLKPILKSLYYPDSPYEFSVLPADILGQTYEQFLGKVIRLTAGHRAVVEDKPEVKKAGGVYYTPTYIVDYIVQHTVSKLLENQGQCIHLLSG